MNAHIFLGSLCCLAVLAACDAAEAAALSNQETGGSQREISEDLDGQESGPYGGHGASLAPNSPYQQQRMDRIKFALSTLLAGGGSSPMHGIPAQQPLTRLQVRSAPGYSADQEISAWFESALSDLSQSVAADQQAAASGQRGAIQTRDGEHGRGEQAAVAAAAAANSLASSMGSSGHKTIRNAPVFMRLPPRFGKRNFWAIA